MGILPAILEYVPLASAEQWRVEKFELLAAELELTSKSAECGTRSAESTPHSALRTPHSSNGFATVMSCFHEFALTHPRPWLIARRLYGIGPVMLPTDAHPDDSKQMSRPEICVALGLDKDELQAELDALRTLWQNHLQREEKTTETPKEPNTQIPKYPNAQPQPSNGEIVFDDDVLKEFGFVDSMFKVCGWDAAKKEEVPRDAEETRIEKAWFAGRVAEWRKMLSEPMASALARRALLNELHLRRIDTEQSIVSPSSSKYQNLYTIKRQMEEAYQEQLDGLQQMFPEMAIAGKVSFRAVISDLNKAHRDYYGHADRRLVDKIHTAAEIQVELRQSAQSPQPRYRFGLNVAIVEAIHGLYDPNFRTQLRMSDLKKLDTGFREAIDKVRQATNEPLVDLEDGVLPGEGGEYAELKEVAA